MVHGACGPSHAIERWTLSASTRLWHAAVGGTSDVLDLGTGQNVQISRIAATGPGHYAGGVPCVQCGKRQTDPAKGASPWARLVTKGQQVLLCPACQTADPLWQSRSDHCPTCDSTRLSVMLGSVVCRACGEIQTSE
jgi:hypothetical protein